MDMENKDIMDMFLDTKCCLFCGHKNIAIIHTGQDYTVHGYCEKCKSSYYRSESMHYNRIAFAPKSHHYLDTAPNISEVWPFEKAIEYWMSVGSLRRKEK